MRIQDLTLVDQISDITYLFQRNISPNGSGLLLYIWTMVIHTTRIPFKLTYITFTTVYLGVCEHIC